MYSPSPKAKRIEFRCPDPSCNPYLAFSALMMAAVDGIQNEIDPGGSLDVDIYDLSPEESQGVPTTPATLDAALDALEDDHEFLTAGGVFSEDVIINHIEYKRGERGAGGGPAAASARVRAVLRHIEPWAAPLAALAENPESRVGRARVTAGRANSAAGFLVLRVSPLPSWGAITVEANGSAGKSFSEIRSWGAGARN